MSRFRQTLAAVLTAAILLTLSPAVAAWDNDTRSADVVSAALGEVGYTEEDNEFSKYGQWYGYPHSYWCAMFVSWAGNEAGVPSSILPRGPYCSAIVNTFSHMGRFQDSAARGGEYTPVQGDLIFYYAPDSKPEGNTLAVHMGIVLYVEAGQVFTVEGNTLPCRLDLPELTGDYDESLDPPDYVTVNNYPLTARHILGYGIPDYADHAPLELTGFVDLGNHKDQAKAFSALAEAGILPGTSSHTCSPRQGLPRGAFVRALMTLYGLNGFPEDTPAFSDVPAEHPYFNALMTARSLGIFSGSGNNTATPDRYITGPDAQALISRTLQVLGLPDLKFTFTPGDRIIFGDYTIRADLAAALYALLSGLGTPTPYPGTLRQGEQPLDWAALTMNGTTYVPLDAMQATYPQLEAILPDAPSLIPGTVRVLPGTLPLTANNATTQVPAFDQDGAWYVALRPTAELLDLELTWDQPTGAIVLN